MPLGPMMETSTGIVCLGWTKAWKRWHCDLTDRANVWTTSSTSCGLICSAHTLTAARQQGNNDKPGGSLGFLRPESKNPAIFSLRGFVFSIDFVIGIPTSSIYRYKKLKRIVPKRPSQKVNRVILFDAQQPLLACYVTLPQRCTR